MLSLGLGLTKITVKHKIVSSGGGDGGNTTGQPIGLLLILTKAS